MADELLIPIKVVKRGSAKGKVLGETQPANVNKSLKRALAKAYKWDEDLMNVQDRDQYLFQNNLEICAANFEIQLFQFEAKTNDHGRHVSAREQLMEKKMHLS